MEPGRVWGDHHVQLGRSAIGDLDADHAEDGVVEHEHEPVAAGE
jgi:hypothetical protein